MRVELMVDNKMEQFGMVRAYCGAESEVENLRLYLTTDVPPIPLLASMELYPLGQFCLLRLQGQ